MTRKLEPLSMAHPHVSNIWRELRRYKEQNCGNSPSVRQLGLMVGLCHPSMVHSYLNYLEGQGLIRRTKAGIDLVGYEYKRVTS